MSKRQERISDFIQQEISSIITRELELPEGVIFTVTKVDVSGDYRYALIWLSILPPEQAESMLKFMKNKQSLLQRELFQRMSMKFSPTIHFRLDERTQTAFEIQALLDEIREQDERENKQ